MSLLLVDIGGGDCRTSELLSALTAGASMPSTLRLGTNYAEEGDAALDDRCLQELAAGPSASDALQELAVELDEAVTVAGLRALGGLPALRRLTLTCGAFPSAAFHPWAVTQLAHLTVECGSASGAEVITALAAARVPRLSSLTLRASVPLPRLVEPALASLRLRRFRSLWCWTRLREDVARPSFPTDPAWLAVNEWVRPLWGGGGWPPLASARASLCCAFPPAVHAWKAPSVGRTIRSGGAGGTPLLRCMFPAVSVSWTSGGRYVAHNRSRVVHQALSLLSPVLSPPSRPLPRPSRPPPPPSHPLPATAVPTGCLDSSRDKPPRLLLPNEVLPASRRAEKRVTGINCTWNAQSFWKSRRGVATW